MERNILAQMSKTTQHAKRKDLERQKISSQFRTVAQSKSITCDAKMYN